LYTPAYGKTYLLYYRSLAALLPPVSGGDEDRDGGGRNSGSNSPVKNRIWKDNRQGGGIVILPVTVALFWAFIRPIN